MKTHILFLMLLCEISTFAQSYTVQGSFPQIKNIEVQLIGYTALKDTFLYKTQLDSVGNFVLKYPKSYVGAALLQIKNSSSLVILINQENFEILWGNLEDVNTLKFTNSLENEAFSKGIKINQEAEGKLAGLKYLKKLYEADRKKLKAINKEINYQEVLYHNYLEQLPKGSYSAYYLTIRKLVEDFPFTANRYIERMSQHEEQFNDLDFNDTRLHQSGLFKELLEGYFKLLESHGDMDMVYEHANPSIDALLKSLLTKPALQQEVAEYLFKYFEKRSLFGAAEYLALSMLNQDNCEISEKHLNLFEQYRKMAIGNTAPNIALSNNKDLYVLPNKYRLIIFGASWCPNCQEEYPRLKQDYLSLKEQYDLEMVYISIDTDINAYENYYQDAPFITYCDTKGWETQSAKNYHIFATPTMYLLDKENKILLKPKSPEHLQAWMKARL